MVKLHYPATVSKQIFHSLYLSNVPSLRGRSLGVPCVKWSDSVFSPSSYFHILSEEQKKGLDSLRSARYWNTESFPWLFAFTPELSLNSSSQTPLAWGHCHRAHLLITRDWHFKSKLFILSIRNLTNPGENVLTTWNYLHSEDLDDAWQQRNIFHNLFLRW